MNFTIGITTSCLAASLLSLCIVAPTQAFMKKTRLVKDRNLPSEKLVSRVSKVKQTTCLEAVAGLLFLEHMYNND